MGECGEGEAMTTAENTVRLLREAGATLSTTESCTGGLIASLITGVPGASQVFPGGAVTYSNASKAVLAGVDAALIAEKGPVSPEVASQMAEGIRRVLGSTLAVSVTGLCGPDGDGTAAKVGDVYIGFASPEGTEISELHQNIGREPLRALAAETALKVVCRWCEGHISR